MLIVQQKRLLHFKPGVICPYLLSLLLLLVTEFVAPWVWPGMYKCHCITLPETPSQRQSFDSYKSYYGFTVLGRSHSYGRQMAL